MELRATVEGLKAINTDKKRKVNIYTDSEYVRWVLAGVVQKVPKANAQLISELLQVAKNHDVTCVKVRGHADTKKNERALDFSWRKSAETALRKSLEDQMDAGFLQNAV